MTHRQNSTTLDQLMELFIQDGPDAMAVLSQALPACAGRWGAAHFAAVQGTCSRAGREIQRCWSATADGYADEAWRCLDAARAGFGRTRQLLAEAADRAK